MGGTSARGASGRFETQVPRTAVLDGARPGERHPVEDRGNREGMGTRGSRPGRAALDADGYPKRDARKSGGHALSERVRGSLDTASAPHRIPQPRPVDRRVDRGADDARVVHRRLYQPQVARPSNRSSKPGPTRAGSVRPATSQLGLATLELRGRTRLAALARSWTGLLPGQRSD